MEKHGSAISASATLTQQQLDEALPSGFHIEPMASGGGEVEARASGGLFGVQASITALVKPLEGRLVAEPQGLPAGGPRHRHAVLRPPSEGGLSRRAGAAYQAAHLRAVHERQLV